ncbi:uncharacterized protein LOC108041851 [Drosophila rhopaloa]|uniref:Uncharacterized protein LOC108041851 n=1 Tax=Drosophila rhopaloa TaxID=1041015 RepID=A0A6P4EQ11_DRORH|nr:uncharacterized protein LOC108041851 [Drosophila rhopaloa]
MFVYTDKLLERQAILTMHYIQELAVINRLLCVSDIDRDIPDGDKSIRDMIAAVLQKFNCTLSNDAAVGVTENDASIKNAFAGQQHVLCINTQLNQAFVNVFSEAQQLQYFYRKCDQYF